MKGNLGADRVWIAALGVAGAVAGILLGITSSTQPAAPSIVDSSPAGDPSPTLVAVHVSGWVATPGVVWIPDGSLVAVAIESAGGAVAGARLDGINLAARVHEGDQVAVPGPGGGPDGSGESADGLVDINTANETELQALPGVGPVLAARIVAYREKIGRFDSIEDLLDVAGIGETRLASIRDLIVPP